MSNNWRKRFAAKAGLDKPVFYSIAGRFWSLVAGPVTVILIGTHFSPELQGYHYAFASLLSLQAFAELGLGTVIIQFASHEWARLALVGGRITGDADALSRLRSVARFGARWYLVAASFLTVLLAVGGTVFFSRKDAHGIEWLAPWLALCLLTGANLFMLLLWSLLEGCNQVARVYLFRLVVVVSNSVSVWLAILGGLQLWTAAVWNAVSLVCTLILFIGGYRHLFASLFFGKVASAKISWRADMLPLQWRIAVSWLGAYCMNSLFTPVLCQYHGPVVAGQMGMTWSLVAAVAAIATAWPNTKIAPFGVLVAQKKRKELDREFIKTLKISVSVAILGALSGWLLVLGLGLAGTNFAARLLPPLPTGLFLAATVLLVAQVTFQIYLRAHKKDPTMWVSALGAAVVVLSNFTLGKWFSVTAMAAGYLAANAVLLPVTAAIWLKYRRDCSLQQLSNL